MNENSQVRPATLHFRPGSADEWIMAERSYTRLLEAIRPGDSVLDIGGYIGTFAAKAAERGGQVVAYEPNPMNFVVLEENARRFGFQARAEAIAKTEGDTVFWVRAGLGLPHGTLIQKALYSPITVHAVAASSLPGFNIVKIDVEGTEVEVFESLDLSLTRGLAIEFELAAKGAKVGNRAEAERIDARLVAEGYRRFPPRAITDLWPKTRVCTRTYLKEAE